MSRLEPAAGATSREPTVVDLRTGDGHARLAIPPDADGDEVAALVAAMTTRLGEAADGDETAADRTDRWTLAGRLGLRRRCDLPRRCRRGGEWAAAGRRP